MLEVMMHRNGGFEVLRHVCRNGWRMPVLRLSARGDDHDRFDGLEFGVEDHVVKPFALGEMLARMQAVLRRRAMPIALRDSLRIQPERLRGHGGDVELKESGLLAALAQEPGRVFGPLELLDAPRGSDVVVNGR